MRTLQTHIKREVHAIAFSADGKTLAVGGNSGIALLSLPDFTERSLYSGAKKFFAFEFDPLGRYLYLPGVGSGHPIYSLSSGSHPWQGFAGTLQDQHIVSLSPSNDGKRLALSRGVFGHNRAEVWNLTPTGVFSLAWTIREERTASDPVSILEGESLFFSGVAFSPTNALVAVAGKKRSLVTFGPQPVQLCAADSGKLIGSVGEFPEAMNFSMRFIPDGTAILGSDEQWLQLHALDGKILSKFAIKRGRATIRGAAIHPSGRFVATVGYDGCVNCYELPALTLLRTYKWDAGKLHAIAFNPDGTLGAAGSDGGKVIVWDVDL